MPFPGLPTVALADAGFDAELGDEPAHPIRPAATKPKVITRRTRLMFS